MVDPAAPASTRVRAADSVLGHAKQAIELERILRYVFLNWNGPRKALRRGGYDDAVYF
jgi:hypothetical protein